MRVTKKYVANPLIWPETMEARVYQQAIAEKAKEISKEISRGAKTFLMKAMNAGKRGFLIRPSRRNGYRRLLSKRR